MNVAWNITMPNKAVFFKQPGEPSVLTLGDVPDPKDLKPGQVAVRHTAIGVNYMDAYFRSGLYKTKQTPFIPGIEAAGVIEAVGPGVNLKEGRRVAYALATSGAYAQRRVIDSKKLVPIPDTVTDDVAAAALHSGMVAHMLLYRVYRVRRKDIILIHNATDTTGHVLCQWAKQIGATIIGTVDHNDKLPAAKRYGCDYVVNYKEGGLVQIVRDVTKGNGVTLVYDSVGKDTFSMSLQSLMPLGMYVSYDQSSGAIPGINILSLATKSIYLTRPSVQLYKANTIEMALTANETFEKIRKGELNITIGATYNLKEAANAHADMQTQKSIGSIILKP